MAPTELEERCAALVCEYLNGNPGGEWRVDAWLDESNDSEQSPDALLTNGFDCIAVEIKRLTDSAAFDCHEQDTKSLYRKLAPKTGGDFFLIPPPGVWRSFDRQLIRQLKRRIGKAAAHLKVGESTEIEVPRQATIRFCGENALGVVHCTHTNDDVFPVRLQGVDGLYFLEDCGGPRHQFMTNNRRTDFYCKLEEICAEIRQEGQDAHSVVQWSEEWELRKTRDKPNDIGGVLVCGVAADFLEAAAMNSLKTEIGKGKQKFEKRKWAHRSAVALQAGVQQREVPLNCFYDALSKLENCVVHPLDMVFLVSEEGVWHVDFTY